ncbi:MAG: 30S ribosome-binding factor RbfA [Candidatus Schekmanbacteria bacterium]|nr:30S ribosome-binding factor RbfA [Candidatus Schekmanbacteria bacterium]
MIPRPSARLERLAELLHQEISRIVKFDVKDPRTDSVTITRVALSSDFRHAKVYYVASGAAVDRKSVEHGINSAVGFIQHLIGQRIRVKHTPTLRFIYDLSIEQGDHVVEALDRLSTAPPAEPQEGGE